MLNLPNKLDLYRQACELLNVELEDDSAQVRENYSGRSTYGSTVPGIVSSASGPVVGAAIMYVLFQEVFSGDNPDMREPDDLHYEDQAALWNMVPKHQDSMGFSTIYY